jgi:hypothetical protein
MLEKSTLKIYMWQSLSKICTLAVNEAIHIALRDVALRHQIHSRIDSGEVYRPTHSTACGRNGTNYCFLRVESRAIPKLSLFATKIFTG